MAPVYCAAVAAYDIFLVFIYFGKILLLFCGHSEVKFFKSNIYCMKYSM